MNEHIIQLLQNEDDNNRLLGIHLAVGDGWSVDDIHDKLLKWEGNNKDCYVNGIGLEVYAGNEPRYAILEEGDDEYKILYYQKEFKTLAEYQAKFIELLLN